MQAVNPSGITVGGLKLVTAFFLVLIGNVLVYCKIDQEEDVCKSFKILIVFKVYVCGNDNILFFFLMIIFLATNATLTQWLH